MKVEPTSSNAGRSEGAGAPARREQWLLDLERALLEKWPRLEASSDGRAGQHPAGGTAPAEAGKPETVVLTGRAETSSQTAEDVPAARADTAPHPDAAPHDWGNDLSVRVARLPDRREGQQASDRPDDLALPREDRNGEMEDQACIQLAVGGLAPSMDIAADALRSGDPVAISTVPSSMRVPGRMVAPGFSGGDRPGNSTSPAQYAKRLLHLAGTDGLRVNVRDAALTQVQQAAVASALFVQLQGLGRAVSQIYVNGVLFSPAKATADASARLSAPSLPNNPSNEE